MSKLNLYKNQFNVEEFKDLYETDGIFKYYEEGFTIDLADNLYKIGWNEIIKITAYKIDLITSDEICLSIESENDIQFQVSESTEGWFQFVKRTKEIYPTINKKWEFEISTPAFKRNETLLFKRD